MTGIVKILFDTHPIFAGGRAGQERTHQQPVTLQPVEMCKKSVDKSLLIILWSTVQVRDVPPFNSTTYEPPVSKLGAFFFSRLRTDYKLRCFGYLLFGAVL